MGSGVAVECINCGYTFDAMTGVGMMYSSLSKVMFAVHYKRRPIIEDIIDNHSVQESEYSHKVYRCSDCGTFGRRFHVKIQYDQGSIYETTFKCSKCRKPLVDVNDEDLTQYRCPKCKEQSLHTMMMCDWD